MWWVEGGEGKCSRRAANLSPGDSKVTAGTPKVAASKEAIVPPKLRPGEVLFFHLGLLETERGAYP